MTNSTIGKISRVLQTGKTPPSKIDEYFVREYNWYTPGDIINKKYLKTSDRHISSLAVKDRKATLYPKNSLLITCIGNIGRVGISTEESASNQQITAIKPNEDVDVNYLYYWFLKNQKLLSLKANKAVVPILNNRSLKEIPFKYPPLKTQERIAAILDDAAALRDKTAQLLKEYDLLAQSIFLEMFGDPVRNPKGWDEVLFNKVLVLRRGFDLPIQSRIKGKVPIIASNGILDWHNEFKVKGPGIVTGRSGTLGKVHFVETDYWPLNTALYSQDLNGNNPIYLLYLLKNFRVERFTRGAGVPTLNRNLVHSEMIYKTSIKLQNQFAEKIALIEQQKELAKQELKESEDLFNCLLQKAFKGELV